LRRLGTDYIDVYQAHRFDRTVPLEETMLAFADLVRQGKVLYVGTSEWTAEQVTRASAQARELHIPFISNQAQYSMLWRVPEVQVIPACRQEGMGLIAWSPLAQGVLTGKYKPGTAPPEGSRATDARAVEGRGAKFFRGFLNDDVLARVTLLDILADDLGHDLPSLALAWVLNNESVSTAIIGASRPEQVVGNAKAVDVTLDEDTVNAIDEILAGLVKEIDFYDQTP
jgi:aryl-alcohol dehydrogenase-like predicted oxidoreductase